MKSFDTPDFRQFVHDNLDADTLAAVNTLWEELMLNGGMGIAVYILAAVIVVALVAFVLYRRAVKKKREKMYE